MLKEIRLQAKNLISISTYQELDRPEITDDEQRVDTNIWHGDVIGYLK